LRDVFGLPRADVGDGWLIFGLPPAEVRGASVHPQDGGAPGRKRCTGAGRKKGKT
jgi:hypothetical protein